jgi:hypothetical protein
MKTRILLGSLLTAGVLLQAVAGQPAASRPADGSFRAAIFISNRVAGLEAKTGAFEDLVTARVTDLGFRVLSREIVADSLRGFDPALASAPRPADSLDSRLSEQSSALRLAQGLGADYLLVGSLVSIGTSRRAIDAYGVHRTTEETTLRFAYKVIDGRTGATLTADAGKASRQVVQGDGAREASDDVADGLMDEAAQRIAASLESRVTLHRIPSASEAAPLAAVTINLEAADMAVPDVRIDGTNTVRIVAGQGTVHPLNATVELDGIAVGSAPGVIHVRPGFSKLKITRDGFKPWERTINAVDGQTLDVALELSDTGYARWKDATAFLNGLKNGARLTDAEAERIRGQAKMLSQSGYRVDTKDAPPTNIFRD